MSQKYVTNQKRLRDTRLKAKKPVSYLKKVVLDQKAVPGGRGVDGDGRDLPLLELKAQLTGRILVQCQRSLERSRKCKEIFLSDIMDFQKS